MWLPWKIAVACGLVLGVISLLRWRGRAAARWERLRPWVRELAVLFVLYAAWRRFAEITVMSTDRAFERGRDLWELQRTLHLPNELTMQRWTLRAEWLVRAANLYYIVVHVIPVGVFLAWLFAWHRPRYRRWRSTLALSSLVILVLQWVPVAPPRLYPELGFVDTGAVYGPRVYDDAGAGTAGQLSAMPSMHVAWAVVIGFAVFACGRGRWRWLGVAHALLTTWAVTVTAYHWIADAIVAAAVVGVFAWLTGRWERWRAQVGASDAATSFAAATTSTPNR